MREDIVGRLATATACWRTLLVRRAERAAEGNGKDLTLEAEIHMVAATINQLQAELAYLDAAEAPARSGKDGLDPHQVFEVGESYVCLVINQLQAQIDCFHDHQALQIQLGIPGAREAQSYRQMLRLLKTIQSMVALPPALLLELDGVLSLAEPVWPVKGKT